MLHAKWVSDHAHRCMTRSKLPTRSKMAPPRTYTSTPKQTISGWNNDILFMFRSFIEEDSRNLLIHFWGWRLLIRFHFMYLPTALRELDDTKYQIKRCRTIQIQHHRCFACQFPFFFHLRNYERKGHDRRVIPSRGRTGIILARSRPTKPLAGLTHRCSKWGIIVADFDNLWFHTRVQFVKKRPW